MWDELNINDLFTIYEHITPFLLWWEGTGDVVTYILIILNVLFFLIILTWILISIDKRNKHLHERYIVGSWLRKGHTPEGEPWEIVYTFTDRNQFKVKAIPELNENGIYKIIKEVENLLVVELYKQIPEGGVERELLHIGIDPKANQMNINDRSYKRINERK